MKVKSWFVTLVFLAAISPLAQARYYDPTNGRFVSADTLVPSAGDPQSFNRYAYVRNNPVKLIDPSGHSWLSKTIDKVNAWMWMKMVPVPKVPGLVDSEFEGYVPRRPREYSSEIAYHIMTRGNNRQSSVLGGQKFRAVSFHLAVFANGHG